MGLRLEPVSVAVGALVSLLYSSISKDWRLSDGTPVALVPFLLLIILVAYYAFTSESKPECPREE